ncbi:MAG: hypothetical protein ABJC19_09790 [Gemmatimonadota bacterium]
MTSFRFALSGSERRPFRIPTPKWLGLVIVGAILGVIGGASLAEMLAMMLLRVLFIVFSTAFLILFFVLGMAWARTASSVPPAERAGPDRRSPLRECARMLK